MEKKSELLRQILGFIPEEMPRKRCQGRRGKIEARAPAAREVLGAALPRDRDQR
jgi:hypothetical protein